jgi:DNA polymerase III alpha subunit
MDVKERLTTLCNEALVSKGIKNELHEKRLASEFREINAKDAHGYFIDLHDRKVRYPRNPNNLLVPYLLDLVSNVEIEKPPEVEYGDPPDIDVDYLPAIRDRLKNIWAPERFGRDKVCNIGSYNTFGIRSSLIDMAKVCDKDRNEILNLTTQLESKDDEGKTLTWEKAMELYPELKKYCEVNQDVAEAAQKLLNRNRSMGKHAGGLIVSRVPIDQFVPLVRDKEGNPLSAWVEGLHGQDLGPMGLIKFDLLVITNLMQIALAVKMIKERHKLDGFFALPGDDDWTDMSWLSDPKALAMADKADLKCIFQMDSDGIRKMIKAGGVTSFDDLVAYTALYRPGPLGMKMQEHFIDRKRGKEKYEVHQLLKPILDVTYGVLVYQEQIIKILHAVGKIPEKDCETIRKAISKKKAESFAKYKDMFLANGQITLGWTLEEVQNLWDQISAFAEYGFNKSHAVAYTYISMMLLCIKAHYPLEFFAAILECEDKSEKIKEYKVEAGNHGIPVCPLDINKSGKRFQIVGDSIYIGFGNLKGIGDAVAEKIVSGQPYTDFKDFLNRFGTDASTVKPLIGLNAFKEDPVNSWKYNEWHKEQKKKREDRKKRFELSRQKTLGELQSLVPVEVWETVKDKVDEGEFVNTLRGCLRAYEEQVKPVENDVHKAVTKYEKSCLLYKKKVEADELDPPLFLAKDVVIPAELEATYKSAEESEKAFYGFIWTHPLEKSPDYEALTFERFRTEELIIGCVQVRILEAKRQVSKNKKTVYYLLKTEDAHGEEVLIQVWEDDWQRFEDWLTVGAMVRLKVQAPDSGFRRYTLYAPPRHKRERELPKNREYDYRIVVMRTEGT